jgi:hypothetical protein
MAIPTITAQIKRKTISKTDNDKFPIILFTKLKLIKICQLGFDSFTQGRGYAMQDKC